MGLVLLVLIGCSSAPMEDDPDALLERGWDYFRLGEFSMAVRAFTAARDAVSPDEPLYIEATFGLANTWNLRLPRTQARPDLAGEYYRDVIGRAPDGDWAAYSQLALARMIHLAPVGEHPDYDAVRAAYRQVVDRFPAHPAGHEAFIYLQSTLVRTLDPADARRAATALRKWMGQYPDTGFMSAAWSLLSVAYDTLGDHPDKLHAEIRAMQTAEVDPKNPFHDNAGRYWTIAVIAEFDVGDFTTARTYYRRLIDEYPTDIRRFASSQALARMDELESRLRADMRGRTP